jgi:myo-inositol-1(or 4)-monophosphatase
MAEEISMRTEGAPAEPGNDRNRKLIPARSLAAKHDYSRELAVAKKAALAAGKVLAGYWRRGDYEVNSKGRGQPVTEADLEADRTIKQLIKAAFPRDGWLSEETADSPGRLEKSRVWIVDPLDGTKEFINRIAEFSVAIALSHDGEAVVGVTYNPIKREMYTAARGMGCFLGTKRVRVTRTRVLKRALVLASRSEIARGEWQVFDGVVGVSPTGSVAYKLAMVAAGKGDATFTRSPKSEWDIASGAALIAEAGGIITDIDGKPLRFNQSNVKLHGLIASNGVLHQRLAQLAQENLLPREGAKAHS